MRLSSGPFGCVWALLLGFVGAALAATVATARADGRVLVYHSPTDDGVPAPARLVVDAATPQVLNLYVDLAGTEATRDGVVCESGDGTELCGWDFTVRASPGIAIRDFVPEPGVVALLDGRNLRVNGLHASGPSTAPVRIGRLRIVGTAASGGTIVVRGVAVAADLSLEELAETTVAEVVVPEPTPGWVLASGAGLLAWLGQRRARSVRPGRPARAARVGRAPRSDRRADRRPPSDRVLNRRAAGSRCAPPRVARAGRRAARPASGSRTD